MHRHESRPTPLNTPLPYTLSDNEWLTLGALAAWLVAGVRHTATQITRRRSLVFHTGEEPVTHQAK